MCGQDNNEVLVNVVENIEAEDTAATFQYGRHDVLNNTEELGATSRTTKIFGNIFRKLTVNRYKNKHAGRSENDIELTSYGINESSEGVREEDFKDDILLIGRT